ncbi:uncharacterized protein DUF4835 [Christiangramia gaetbulicola]|uniref:Uncharacterized protein DUF4835 n=1 Tax=Christiangramia gaetbulicola TaxID=703340 RepID=A0A2T6AIX3_9FLAO|nr:DUF4835 family protein [Christiangramia gaetbulicola]PTX43751.1 uncharacterized protein DUF4835 [Christiangramia gaetbulicola]
MHKVFSFILIFIGLQLCSAQQVNCEIIVNAEQTGQANLSVFKTLERSLNEFVNQTNWTDKRFQPHERINCSMFITITSFEGESFNGTIQVQSSRPVYGSSMITPVFNFNDEQLAFNYREYQPLNYSENTYTSNLVSVVSFYVYTIMGLDADTFAPEGGTPYYEEANRIVTSAQQGNSQGWKGSDGQRSRFRLNADILANTYAEYRTALYEYHRLGLDVMHEDLPKGKAAIAEAMEKLEVMNNRRNNSLLLRTFFDSKADEITSVYSGGPAYEDSAELIETLNNIAPRYARNWRNIR